MAMTEIVPGEAWKLEGACIGHDPKIWFPTRGEDVEAARAICMTCPVRLSCAEYGMTQKHGMWGGLSERQRRRIRRQRGIRLPAATSSEDVPRLDDRR